MTTNIPPVSPDGQSLDYQPRSAVETHVANQQERAFGTTPAQPVKQARDRAQYVRQQKGKSWIVWWLLLGPVTLWIPAVYYSFSPNYYWHA